MIQKHSCMQGYKHTTSTLGDMAEAFSEWSASSAQLKGDAKAQEEVSHPPQRQSRLSCLFCCQKCRADKFSVARPCECLCAYTTKLRGLATNLHMAVSWSRAFDFPHTVSQGCGLI
jgi:hypothetical protein